MHHRQAGCVDFYQGDVGAAVHTQHPGLEFTLVSKPHRDLGGVGHDVGIGEDGAIGADNKARALALFWLRTLLRHRKAEAAEQLKGRVVGVRGGLALERGDADVDHGGAFALHQCGEVGQAAGIDRGCGKRLGTGGRRRGLGAGDARQAAVCANAQAECQCGSDGNGNFVVHGVPPVDGRSSML